MWPFKKRISAASVPNSPRQISMFDRVRILDAPLTRQLGIAGLIGTVYGESKPSSSGVEVSGPCPDDFALNISFEGHKDTIWLAPGSVQFVDHAPGTEVQVGSVRLKRSASGDWIDQ
jgi:hypothetical protein